MTTTEIVLAATVGLTQLGFYLSDWHRQYCTKIAIATLEKSIADSKRIILLLSVLKQVRNEVGDETANKIDEILADYPNQEPNQELGD